MPDNDPLAAEEAAAKAAREAAGAPEEEKAPKAGKARSAPGRMLGRVNLDAPYGVVSGGETNARYYQDGKFYDSQGKACKV